MSDDKDEVDLPTALTSDAVRDGAAVSFSGDTLVVTGDGIVEAVETRLLGGTQQAERRDHWLIDGVPVLSRGEAWIVPLSWEPVRDGGRAAPDDVLRGRAHDLWMSVRSACEFRQGMQIGVDLRSESPRNPYAKELARTGVRRADWWAFGGFAAVLAVYGEPLPAPVSKVALHVVPVGWVSARRPTAAKKMPALDLSWSWADVVAFAESDAAGSLAEHKTEGQGS
ncbi:hypothetical protein [Microbacterium sp. NPDC056234]|uniref:hypothetical protein n=1 Tax=Microbacterium sp. NPDC056234 TaxID=3345757 RepID=UPI0035DE2119